MVRFIPFKAIMQPILGSIRSLKFINNRLRDRFMFRTICIPSDFRTEIQNK